MCSWSKKRRGREKHFTQECKSLSTNLICFHGLKRDRKQFVQASGGFSDVFLLQNATKNVITWLL